MNHILNGLVQRTQYARSLRSTRTCILPRKTIPISTRTRTQARTYGQGSSSSEASSSRRRIPSPLTLLLIAGIGATAFGIYDIYGMLTLWPPEVRTDLRGGLKAKDKGNLELSALFLERAWETSKTLPIDLFKPEPHLKTSGIAIVLASVYEANGKLEKAYGIYLSALIRLQEVGAKDHLSGPEKLRAIAISYKLGEMAALLQRKEEEERHLVWAVEAILHSFLHIGEGNDKLEHMPTIADTTPGDMNTRIMVSELPLPNWATRTDIAAPLEALGTFYAQAGRTDYAMPLYLQAISILVPPSPQNSSDEDRCRGAELMSHLSEMIMSSQTQLTEELLHQAEAWATKGLEVTMQTKKNTSSPNPTCELAFAVTLFNVAALRRMAGDKEGAKKLFLRSMKQSKIIGLQSGIEHAEEALRQMENEATNHSPDPLTPKR